MSLTHSPCVHPILLFHPQYQKSVSFILHTVRIPSAKLPGVDYFLCKVPIHYLLRPSYSHKHTTFEQLAID